MRPAAFIEELASRDIHLSAKANHLCIDAPPGVLVPDLVARLKANKTSLMQFLNSANPSANQPRDPPCQTVDPVRVSKPFNQTAMDAIKSGKAVPIWSTVLNERTWWVRDEPERKQLKAQCPTEAIYTLGELYAVQDYLPEDLKIAHALKKEFNAIVNIETSDKLGLSAIEENHSTTKTGRHFEMGLCTE